MLYFKIKTFVASLVLLCCFAVPSVAEVTLAIIAPKAGKYAKAGEELFNGAKLAIKEVNDNGGLNGEKLDILTIDDRCDDRLAVSAAEMLTLLNSKTIGLVIGPYCSNRFEEAANIYEKGKIFQIVPTTMSYDAGNTEKKGQILLLGTKAQISEDFFKFYNANFAGLKTGFIYNDKPEDGYAEVAKALYDEFRRYGKGNLLKFYALNQKTYGSAEQAEAVVKDGQDIVFVLGEKGETIDFIESIKKEKKNIIIFTNKRMLQTEDLQKLGKAANGIYLIGLSELKDSLMFTENLVNLRLLGIEPEGLEVYSYVAVKLWGDLVQSVKSFSYDKLLKAVANDNVKEKWGEFLMHSGSMKSSKYIIEQYIDGGLKQVY